MNRLNSLLFTSFIALGGLIGCAQTGHAARLADVTIVNRDTGERLTAYRHQGQLYVAGTPGQRYAVELRNRDGGRILSVMSVDGINVLTGETAAPDQSGYVLSPSQRYSITGWRKSMDEVAQFYFTALPDSYAARTDRPNNVGVIGVALFREKPQPVATLELAPASAAAAPYDSAPARERQADSVAEMKSGLASPRKAERLGTGHGAREISRTSYTDFERANDRPDQIVTLFYDSRENLIARGIIPPTVRRPQPNPFPALSFAPDPWR